MNVRLVEPNGTGVLMTMPKDHPAMLLVDCARAVPRFQLFRRRLRWRN
jgi:hypothetical protein